MRPSRRAVLASAAAGGLAGLIPRSLRAAGGNDRKFLFFFAQGGWDPTFVFAPMAGLSTVDVDAEGRTATAGGLTYVDSPAHPSVKRFFDAYNARSCILNGIEVRSITHERCRRLLLTGQPGADGDDWPSTIAAHGTGFLLPHLVVSGPAYSSSYSSSVMRVGESGQLATLLDGTVLAEADQASFPLSASASERVEALATARLASFREQPLSGRQERFARDLATCAEQRTAVVSLEDLDLAISVDGAGTTIPERAAPALTCLERGLSRCAIIEHGGLLDAGWDQHADLHKQNDNYETLFDDLLNIMAELERRPGPLGGKLADEVVVVVFSEMGRAPKLNAGGGKDHWTYTSALLVGPGVAASRVIGGFDEQLVGQPINLSTGEVSESGTRVSSVHLGATLLALAGVDTGDNEPISAAVEG